MSQLAAVIIAGGQGQRLGSVRKAHLKIGGTRLIDLVAIRLGHPNVPLVIATGHWPVAAFADCPGIPVSDLTVETGGPLAGLAAAVAWFATQPQPPRLLLTSAVDVPFLPGDYLSRLQAEIGDAPAAFARFGDTFYPTNALWRFDALATLPQQVLTGTAPKSLKQLLLALGATPVDWHDAPNPFANVNTMADLLALSRR